MYPIELTDAAAQYYRDRPVLQHTSLRIESKQIVAVLGPSGCGKSTLLRLVAGLLRPSAGTVRIFGNDVCAVPPAERRIGFVFQRLALFEHMTAEDNVAFGLRYSPLASDERHRRMQEVLSALHLGHVADRKASELSGGEAQRVALARALAPRPSILLLDEPVSSLDRPLADAALALITRLHRELGLTTLLVTHDREQALSIADRVVVLGADGRVHQDDLPEAVFSTPRTLEVALLTGPLNRLPGTVAASDSGDVLVRTASGSLRARWMGSDRAHNDAKVDVAFRSAWASVLPSDATRPLQVDQIEAKVNQVVSAGGRQRVHCAVDDVELLLDVANGSSPRVGEAIRIELRPRSALAYPAAEGG